VLAVLLVGVPALAQTTPFDLGGNRAAIVACRGDRTSTEIFPAGAFGAGFPAGSIVHLSLVAGRCMDWPNVPGSCVGFFVAHLNPTGCGCGWFSGYLERPTQLALGYDREAVRALGLREDSLRLYTFARWSPGWDPVPGATVDAEAQAVRAAETGFVMGFRWYAIAGERTTAVEQTSWSRVRGLYR
jgi:hypothetical protein